MPFVRVSRDKRGYEHFYLVDPATRRGKPSRARVLYWFRTPPGVQVGREPFDKSARRALEARYPDIAFDWEKLCKVAVPPPEVEPWRERRRVERAAKLARQPVEREETDAEPAQAPPGQPRFEPDPSLPAGRSADVHDAPAQSDEPSEVAADLEREGGEGDDGEAHALLPGAAEPPMADRAGESASLQAVPARSALQPAERRRGRRRGGRRRRRSPGPDAVPAATPPDPPKKDETTG